MRDAYLWYTMAFSLQSETLKLWQETNQEIKGGVEGPNKGWTDGGKSHVYEF